MVFSSCRRRRFVPVRYHKLTTVKYLTLAVSILSFSNTCSFIVYPDKLLFVEKNRYLSIESVQRKFTKRLRGCKNMDYSARLDHLQLQSLEKRRLIADIVLTYRIIFGLIDLNVSDI